MLLLPNLYTSPIVPRLRSLIFVQNLLGKMTHEKLKCSHMLLVTKHEQTKQAADTMIRDHKFHADLKYKQECMDEPMNIL